MINEYLLIGEITRPQGVRGEMRVRPYTDDPMRFEELDTAYVRRGEGDEREQRAQTKGVRAGDARTRGGRLFHKLP